MGWAWAMAARERFGRVKFGKVSPRVEGREGTRRGMVVGILQIEQR